MIDNYVTPLLVSLAFIAVIYINKFFCSKKIIMKK